MENRLKFKYGQQREFLLKVQEKSGLSTNDLAKTIGVVGRSFRDWKREKLTMTLKAAEFFCKKDKVILPEKKEVLIKRWLKIKREAGLKGGIAHFKKYGSPGTKEGRRKGGIKAIQILRARGVVPEVKKFKLPRSFSIYLAEFVGIMLGDGSLSFGQVRVTLNRKKEKDYAVFVKDLCLKLFSEKPKSFDRIKYNTTEVYYYGVVLVNFLCKIGLSLGNKVKQQVDAPEWIKSNKRYRIACLRGLMDTDGGVFAHRYNVGSKRYTYLKISFTNRSLPLLHFVHSTLLELGFSPKLVDNVENKKVWLYNEQQVKEYLRVVGTSNSRLLKNLGGWAGR